MLANGQDGQVNVPDRQGQGVRAREKYEPDVFRTRAHTAQKHYFILVL